MLSRSLAVTAALVALSWISIGNITANPTTANPLLSESTQTNTRRVGANRDDAVDQLYSSVDPTVVGIDGRRYRITDRDGLLVSVDGGLSWTGRNDGLPRKQIYPFTESVLRELTGLGVDPSNADRVAVTTSREIFLSEDAGITWQSIPTRPPAGTRPKGWPRYSTYFTSVAISPHNPDAVLVGTSYEGFYETTDRGKSWRDPSTDLEFLIRGAHFYEEMAAVGYDPLQPQAIALGLGFGHTVYLSDGNRSNYRDLEFPGVADQEMIRSLWFQGADLHVMTDASHWTYRRDAQSSNAGVWREQDRPIFPIALAEIQDGDHRRRLSAAADRAGLYVSSFSAKEEKLDELIAFAKKHGLNSLVLDFKDDYGIVTYDTALALPRKMGAVRVRFDAAKVIEKIHGEGLYLIARMLVFKDRAMYRYQDHAYASWDRVSAKAWAHLVSREDENGKVVPQQVEHWVDPFSEFVWDHNIAIAEELQNLGVDEIQFDYIRFPTDGDLSAITYRHRKQGMDRMDALESFLVKARERLTIPISTDLYGFNSWHRMGHWNGQSIEMVSRYVDVISPMFYPSHFPRDFIAEVPYIERAGRIYEEGTWRAAKIVEGRSLIRPYVQAFRIGGELKMSRSEYGDYLKAQLEGTLAAPSSGYTLWNAGNDYYMATFSLKDYLPNN